LAHWYPIDVALSQARRAVYLDFGPDRRDWGVPVLFMRDREGRLFAPLAKEEAPLADDTTDENHGVNIKIGTEGGTVSGSQFQFGDISGRDKH